MIYICVGKITNGFVCGLSPSETDLCEVLYILLCGYTPFDDEDEDEQDQYVSLVESIYEFDDEDWGHVSKEAKDLVRKCLTVDQKQRYTAKQVRPRRLNHRSPVISVV